MSWANKSSLRRTLAQQELYLCEGKDCVLVDGCDFLIVLPGEVFCWLRNIPTRIVHCTSKQCFVLVVFSVEFDLKGIGACCESRLASAWCSASTFGKHHTWTFNKQALLLGIKPPIRQSMLGDKTHLECPICRHWVFWSTRIWHVTLLALNFKQWGHS